MATNDLDLSHRNLDDGQLEDHLRTLPREQLSKVQYLYLNKNRLRCLPASLFAQFGNLRWLDLRDNQLREVSFPTRSPMKIRLKTLLLQGNPKLKYMTLRSQKVSKRQAFDTGQLAEFLPSLSVIQADREERDDGDSSDDDDDCLQSADNDDAEDDEDEAEDEEDSSDVATVANDSGLGSSRDGEGRILHSKRKERRQQREACLDFMDEVISCENWALIPHHQWDSERKCSLERSLSESSLLNEADWSSEDDISFEEGFGKPAAAGKNESHMAMSQRAAINARRDFLQKLEQRMAVLKRSKAEMLSNIQTEKILQRVKDQELRRKWRKTFYQRATSRKSKEVQRPPLGLDRDRRCGMRSCRLDDYLALIEDSRLCHSNRDARCLRKRTKYFKVLDQLDGEIDRVLSMLSNEDDNQARNADEFSESHSEVKRLGGESIHTLWTLDVIFLCSQSAA